MFDNESAELEMNFVSHKQIVNFMFMYTSQEFIIKFYVTDSFVLATQALPGSCRDGNFNSLCKNHYKLLCDNIY